MDEQQVVGDLADGGQYRATSYMVEIIDPDGLVSETIDLAEVKAVERSGLNVTFKPRKGKDRVLACATIGDAGRLEAAVRPTLPQTAPSQSGGGFGRLLKWGCLGTIGFVALIVVIAMATSGGGSDDTPQPTTASGGASTATVGEATSAATEAPPASTAPESAAVAAIGDRLQAGPWALTVHAVHELEGSEFLPVPEGKRWIAIDLTLENVSNKAEPVSSILQFALRDADGRKYTIDLSAQVAAEGTQPDGEIAAGDKLRAPIAFEVPADASGLIFTFEPSVLSTKDTMKFALE